MDKFREKYKLHNKYRQTKSTPAAVSESKLTKAQKTVDGVNSKVFGSKSTSPTSTSMSVSASSSGTISTASTSFDSGDIKLNVAPDAKNTRRKNSSFLSKNSAYQPLGSGNKIDGSSGSFTLNSNGAVSTISRSRTISKPQESSQEHTNGSKNSRTSDQNINPYHAMPRTEEDEQKGQLPQHDLPSSSFESEKSRDGDGNNPEIAPAPTASSSGHTKGMSTPARKQSKLSLKLEASTKTPPRTAQTHSVVHMVPTEAQLRWAQFHQKKRASETQVRIEKLMKYPLYVQDVDGAENGDGDSFSRDESEFNHGSSKKKFVMSRGRRALLRVSERRTEERRARIKEHGYVMTPDDEEILLSEEDGETEGEGSSVHDLSVTRTVDESLGFDEITDALHVVDPSISEDKPASVLQTEILKSKDHRKGHISSKKKRKSSKKKISGGRHLKGGKHTMELTADEDEERMKRFEEAYTLLCSVKKKGDHVIKASKIWSRASHIPSAISVDGRVYADLQRSPSIKHTPSSKFYGPEVVGAKLNGAHMTDRGASWMMQYPKREKGRPVKFFGHNYQPNSNDEGKGSQGFLSPSTKKLIEIVDRIQTSNSQTIHESPRRRSGKSVRHIGESISSFENDEKYSNKENSRLNEADDTLSPLQTMGGNLTVTSIREKLQQDLDQDVVHNQDGSAHTESDSDPIFDQKIQQIAAQVKSNNSVIDTDNHSDISNGVVALQDERVGHLMMSPAIISKRLKQAIDTIQLGRWEQVGYLVLANPWLAEMNDVNSNQFLLHKLALYGSGTSDNTDEKFAPAPRKLNADLIKASSAAIHKFDNLGNLPLHCAAEAGNTEMVRRLAKIFPGGASVKNNDGQLPLHLAILACANENIKAPISLVSKILSLFPAALAITDNDDNLPLHLAAAFLTGDSGAEVIHLLVDEAENQGENLRFSSAVKSFDDVNDSMTSIGAAFDDAQDEVELSILSIKNTLGWNPLVTAIQMSAGYEVLDALLSRSGIENIAFIRNEFGQTILHQSIVREVCDPPSVVSILKAFPDLVRFRDENGALPIEVACMRGLDLGVIFAIALLDLPIDPDKETVEIRDGFGGSWSYLNCDCDDNYVGIVIELLELCDDYHQKRTLCFMKNKQGKSLMSRATPKCKHELRKSLRFDARYEFIGGAKTERILGEDVKVFDALDFGTDEDLRKEGRRVSIRYYGSKDAFTRATKIIRGVQFDDSLFADTRFFETEATDSKLERCIIVESPSITLQTIVSSMAKKEYRSDSDRLQAYLAKIRKVLKTVGVSIRFLHNQNIIHGNIHSLCCGKFENGWKLSEFLGIQSIGDQMSTSHMLHSVPPEYITFNGGKCHVSNKIAASISLDIWAFGKLMFEVLVGKPLLPHELSADRKSDQRFLQSLVNWNQDDLTYVVTEVENSGNGTLAADLISHCLCNRPELRPKSMDEVLSHSFWTSSSTQRRSINSARKYSSTPNQRFEC